MAKRRRNNEKAEFGGGGIDRSALLDTRSTFSRKEKVAAMLEVEKPTD